MDFRVVEHGGSGQQRQADGGKEDRAHQPVSGPAREAGAGARKICNFSAAQALPAAGGRG